MSTPIRDPRTRLSERSARTPTGCLEWTGATRNGYGAISFYDKVFQAHRISFEIANGREILPGHEIHHRCHNRRCIEPCHLQETTRTEHCAMHPEKDRGENNPAAKLTEDDVLAIRASGDAGIELADRYGVVQSAISHIRNRKRWTHLAVGSP